MCSFVQGIRAAGATDNVAWASEEGHVLMACLVNTTAVIKRERTDGLYCENEERKERESDVEEELCGLHADATIHSLSRTGVFKVCCLRRPGRDVC
jgi:hypothetical protein